MAQLIYDVETMRPPSTAVDQFNSLREYAGAVPKWAAPPLLDPDERARDALGAFAEMSSSADRLLARKLAAARGFDPDDKFPLNTDVDAPAWTLFVGQARKLTAALSNIPDPMTARREERRRLDPPDLDPGATLDLPDPDSGVLARLARSMGMTS